MHRAIVLSAENIILNNVKGPNYKLVNLIKLVIKQYIYAQKCLQETPTFIGAIAEVMDFTISKYLLLLETIV